MRRSSPPHESAGLKAKVLPLSLSRLLATERMFCCIVLDRDAENTTGWHEKERLIALA